MGKSTRGNGDPLLKLKRMDCRSVNRDRNEGLMVGGGSETAIYRGPWFPTP